jgi:hypothetical protein
VPNDRYLVWLLAFTNEEARMALQEARSCGVLSAEELLSVER